MAFDQIMLDLEFFSLAKDAAIASIGAVRFDKESGELGDTFYRVVNLKSSQRAGGRIDADTVMWWMQQSDAARGALCGDDSVLIDVALKEFADWVREERLDGIWGNGADCDNVILEGCYQRSGRTPPWSYEMNRCYRTMVVLHPQIQKAVFVGTAHNALDDAISQAKHLCEIFKTTKGASV